MKKIILSLAATTALGFAVNAYAADDTGNAQSSIDYKKNGGYDSSVKTSETTDQGTSITTKTSDSVDVDSSGNTTETLKSKSVTDPKGLMNKQTHTGELDYKEKDNGGYKKSVTVNDTDRAGTNTYSKQKTDVDVDKNGNVTSTTQTDKVIDPPGLMNKTETVTKTKSVNGVVTEDSTQTK